jgi:hypothetical protein
MSTFKSHLTSKPINLQKKSLTETVAKHHTENSLYMNQSKLSLKTMLDIIIGKSEEVETPDVAGVDVVPIDIVKPVKKGKAKAASN